MTYGTLTLLETVGGEAWRLEGAPPHVVLRFKDIFRSVRRGEVQPFQIMRTQAVDADLSWFMSRYPMTLTDDDSAALDGGVLGFEEARAELGRIFLPDYIPPAVEGFRTGRSLRNYQAAAVEVLRRRYSLLCGDEVGLGKTVVAAGAMMLPDALPAVVVVEPHVQQQWADKIAEFTHLSVHQIKTTKPYSLPPADVYIFRYSNVSGWSDVFQEMEIGLACWDEIQRLRKGTDTQMGKASRVISLSARYRLGLTATPIYNYGYEIWHVLQFIDPDVLGAYDEFAREWAGHWDGLGSYLRDCHVFMRRTRADVGRELPPVNRVVETIDYDQSEIQKIEDLARALAVKTVSGTFTERGQASRELDVMVCHATGVAKAKRVAQFVRVLLEAGEPVLLAGWHRDVYDIWLKELSDHDPVMYTGSETSAAKERAKQACLSGEVQLLILSLRSGAGLDGLQDHFSTVVFGELDWSPGIHHQVIGRLDRDREGNPKQVNALFLVTDEGSDPPMMEVLGLKASQAEQVVDPLADIKSVHSDMSPIRLLADRYLTGTALPNDSGSTVPKSPPKINAEQSVFSFAGVPR